MTPTKKLPLFIITGASGVGKSTISEILFKKEKKYIVLESDLLWNERYNHPETDYREYRELWLRICNNISQIGFPVVLCGCATPKQFECCDERKHFSEIHYLAVVSDDEILASRLKTGRNVSDEDWIKSSLSFNRWLKNNAEMTSPKMRLLDYSRISADEAAKIADEWILKHLHEHELADLSKYGNEDLSGEQLQIAMKLLNKAFSVEEVTGFAGIDEKIII